MTQLAGPIQFKGSNIALRPATGHDRQPFFSRDEAKLYIWDATIGPSGAWVGITSDAVAVDFQLNGSDLAVQNKINFTDDGILQITEDADGELHFDSSGVLGTAEGYTDSAVAAEASARASAVSAEASARASAVSSEASTRSSADGVLATAITTEASARAAAVSAEASARAAAIAALIFPVTKTAGSHKFFSAYDSTTGAFTDTQPAYTDISGTPTLATVATTGAYGDLSGRPTLPATKTNVTHKWLNSYDATTGLFTQTQPDYGDLTGTPSLATVATTGAYSDLTGKPTLPATKAAASTKFLTAYDASTGLFANGQPDFTDLSGTASVAQIPSLAASKITSGLLVMGVGGTGVDLSASGGTTFVLAQDASHVISARALVAADIPSLAASKITTGQLAVARGGSNADLSATGGANQFVKQTSSGGAFTVAALVAGDVPSGIVTWDLLGNAAGALTLANAGNATTFNQTSAVSWTWANSTAATAAGTVAGSPLIVLGARVFSSGVDTSVSWKVQHALNPTTALSFAITNAAESAGNVITLTIGTHTLSVGNWVTVSAISTAAFTYINTLNARITAVAATTIQFTDPSSHGTQASSACNGTVTQIPNTELTFTTSGMIGDAHIILPASAPAVGNGGLFNTAGNSAWHGFGFTATAINPALFISTRGGSGDSFIVFYTDANGTKSPTQRGGISLGDNSAGNSVLLLSTAASTNFSVGLMAGNTTNITNPAIMLGNNTNITATANNTIGLGIGFGPGSTTNLVFAPTSGTATFQATKLKYSINQTGGANGNVTGLLVSAVETAVGGTHLMVDLQAGSAGTTSQFAINNVGKITTYNAIATVASGIAPIYGQANLTAQGANVTATTLYAVPAGGAGLYQVDVYIVVSRAGTTSTMPDTRITFTDQDSATAITMNATASSTGNLLTTFAQATFVVNAKASTNIQYDIGQVTPFASSGGTSMQFAYRARVRFLG